MRCTDFLLYSIIFKILFKLKKFISLIRIEMILPNSFYILVKDVIDDLFIIYKLNFIEENCSRYFWKRWETCVGKLNKVIYFRAITQNVSFTIFIDSDYPISFRILDLHTLQIRYFVHHFRWCPISFAVLAPWCAVGCSASGGDTHDNPNAAYEITHHIQIWKTCYTTRNAVFGG